MRQWQKVLLVVLCAAMAAWVLGGHGKHPEEPSYHGKTLSQWTRLYYNNKHPPTDWAPQSQQNLATDAIRHIGTNALPLLIKWASYDGFSQENKVRARLWPISRIEALVELSSREGDLRAEAAGKALISLGPDAITALPEVARTFYNPTSRDGPARSLWILRQCGQPGLRVLLEAAADKENPIRTTVIYNLGFLRTNAQLALPALTNLLRDPDPAVRFATKEALNRILLATSAQPH